MNAVDNIASWITSLMDSISQFLSTAPLWIQTPLVMVVVIPLCAFLAVFWLRFIDLAGAILTRSRTRKNAPTTASPTLQERQPRGIHGEFEEKAGKDG